MRSVPFCICFSTAPVPSLDESISRIYIPVLVGKLTAGAVVTASFSFSKISWCLSVHLNGTVFLVSSYNGIKDMFNRGRNLLRYCIMPINDLTCLGVFGFDNCVIA